MSNPGRYLVLMPPINGATVFSGTPYFTENAGDKIGRIHPGGVNVLHKFREFTIPTEQALPWDVVAGQDGNVWFSELSGRNVGRITPQGHITEFPVPGDFSGIAGVAPDKLNHIWFTEFRAGKVSSQ